MDTHFAPVAFAEIREATRQHLLALPSAIDSFLEDHILASNHYRIIVAGETAGFASIHEERLITQFALAEPYRGCSQALFRDLRQMEQVRSAFVPTSDEFFLAHAIDDYQQLAKQAYFFATPPSAREAVATDQFSLRPAVMDDAGFVRQESGDFFEGLERKISSGQLFVTLRGEEPVGFGILEQSALYEDVASIGMFTIERFRQSGVGTVTITMLIAECLRRSLRPVAGCWYYNHRSRRTLQRAGMYSPTRLLKIDY
jgi:RimJ/RimL family protein N-acetyltransferase